MKRILFGILLRLISVLFYGCTSNEDNIVETAEVQIKKSAGNHCSNIVAIKNATPYNFTHGNTHTQNVVRAQPYGPIHTHSLDKCESSYRVLV